MTTIPKNKFQAFNFESKENIRENEFNPYNNVESINGQGIGSYSKSRTLINNRESLYTQGSYRINRKITACDLFKQKDPIIDYMDKLTDLTTGINYVNKSSPKFVMKWAKDKIKSTNRPSTTMDHQNSNNQKPRWNNRFKSTDINDKTRPNGDQRSECNNISPKIVYQNFSDVKIEDEQIPYSDINSHNLRPQTCCDPGVTKSQRIASLITPQSEITESKEFKHLKLKKELCSAEELPQPNLTSANTKRESKTGYQKKRNFPMNNRDFIYPQLDQNKRNDPEPLKKKIERKESTESFLAKKFSEAARKGLKTRSKNRFGYFYHASYQKLYKPPELKEEIPQNQPNKNEEQK